MKKTTPLFSVGKLVYPEWGRGALVLWMICCWLTPGPAQERLWLDQATINGKPCRLLLDTGADGYWLFSSAAERLGLGMQEVKPWFGSRKPYRRISKCQVDYGQGPCQTRCFIYELPPFLSDKKLEGDGFVGWPQLGKRIVRFYPPNGKLEFLPQVPPEALGWTKLPLRTRWKSKVSWSWRILALELPQTNGSRGAIIVDTGSDAGVVLNPERWGQWKSAHPNHPSTLTAVFGLSRGVMVREQAWTEAIDLGPLNLTGVVVEGAETWSTGKVAPDDHVAILGLAALKRLDLIVDSRQGLAYVRPRNTPPLAGPHNRLGAVFVPGKTHPDELVAHVVVESPAWQAGVRNGDRLLEVDGQAVSPAPLKAFSMLKAGTKVQLTLKRGSERLKTTAVLREILAPEKDAAGTN